MRAPQARQKTWSDKFIPHIKELIGPQLLQQAPLIEDVQHNTDLMVLGMNSKRIACRVRRAHYAAMYPHDITLRTSSRGDWATEFQKVVQGWGDMMFYGFAEDDDGCKIGRWVLGDLSALRFHIFQKNTYGNLLTNATHQNYDDTTFVSFDYRSIDDFYIAGSHPLALRLL